MLLIGFGRGVVLGGFVSSVKWGVSGNLGRMRFFFI